MGLVVVEGEMGAGRGLASGSEGTQDAPSTKHLEATAPP